MTESRCTNCGQRVAEPATRCAACGPAPGAPEAKARPAARFSPGDLIDAKYEVLSIVGVGGTGELYKVRHRYLHDIRAVKVLRADRLVDPSLRERFLREAKIAASIKHRNVASIYDFSSLPDGSFYMVEEFIEGVTLASRLRAGQKFDLFEIVDTARQVLRGLEALHARDIVHRDISPDNLMLADEEQGRPVVKIIDLGIARPLQAGQGLTSAGFFVGKPYYASPEQLRMIETEQQLDGRTDLYSLGIVLYEMIIGRVPFTAQTPLSYLLQQSSEEVRTLNLDSVTTRLPEELDTFIVTLLRTDREQRFASASHAIEALKKIQHRLPLLIGPESLVPSIEPRRSRKRGIDTAETALRRVRQEMGLSGMSTAAETEGTTVIRPASTPAVAVENTTEEEPTITVSPPTLVDETIVDRPDTPSRAASRTLPARPLDDPLLRQPTVADFPLPDPHERDSDGPQRIESLPSRGIGAEKLVLLSVVALLVVFALGVAALVRSGTRTDAAEPALTNRAVAPAALVSASPAIEPAPPDSPISSTSPDTAVGPVTRTEPPPLRASRSSETIKAPENQSKTVARPPVAGNAAVPVAAAVMDEAVPTVDPPSVAQHDDPTVSQTQLAEGSIVGPGDGVVEPTVRSLGRLEYPAVARRLRNEGTARILVLVSHRGQVEETRLLQSTGFSILDAAAEKAARATTFEPARKDGVAVRMWRPIEFTFRVPR